MDSSRRNRRAGDTVEIYAIRGGDAVKIGLARDVDARRATMQTGSPFPLVIIARTHVNRDAALTIENNAHRHLRKAHIHGEWFRVTDGQARDAIRHGIEAFDQVEAKGDSPPNEWDEHLRRENPRSPQETYIEWLARTDARRQRNILRRKAAKQSRARAL